jgi:hypothetical protein
LTVAAEEALIEELANMENTHHTQQNDKSKHCEAHQRQDHTCDCHHKSNKSETEQDVIGRGSIG